MAYTLALAHSYGRLISELKQQIEKVRGWVGEVVMWAREGRGLESPWWSSQKVLLLWGNLKKNVGKGQEK